MQSVLPIIEIVLIIIVISILYVIISENRTPVKSIAWILVLIFLPIIGIILYFFFGEEHRKKHKKLKRLYKSIEETYPPFHEPILENYPHKYHKFISLLRNISDAPLLEGNEIDFFPSGREKFDRLFKDIRNAKHHIHILYYKMQDDKIGEGLSELLVQKVKEGVAIRIIYDDFGSIKTKKHYFNKMRKEGIEVYSFLEVRIPRITQRFNYRNHRKLVIIDGHIGFIGGMNIGDCYIDGYPWGKWNDVQIRVKGHGVKEMQRIFFRDWMLYKRKITLTPHYFPKVEVEAKNPLQVVSSGPTDIYSSIERGMFQAINEAKKSIYIQTPYFTPSESILTALQTTAVSGVKVSIILPARSDSFFVDCTTHSYINKLLDYGIKVYLYMNGFLHTKCMIVDDFLTILGSANMDTRSFELSFETDVFIYSKETAEKAKAIFVKDLSESRKVTKKSWKKRPVQRRVMQSIMHIFSPLM